MNEKYNKLVNYIRAENRNAAVKYTLQLLDHKDIDLITLYQDVLAYTLNTIDCDLSPDECIWKEHVQTAIVRTIVEVTYPYVIQMIEKQETKNKKVLIVCPSEEFHEVGAKIVHHLFLIAGYDAIFIGANTPTEEIASAVRFSAPDYVAISVTNYYNIVKANQVVETIKKENKQISVIIGGSAFEREEARNQIPHDYYLSTFEDILSIGVDKC